MFYSHTLWLLLGLAFIFHYQHTDCQSLLYSDSLSRNEPKFQVILQIESGYSLNCGGVLINYFYVLTVASCVDTLSSSKPGTLRVLMATSHRHEKQHSYTVKQIIIHEHYTFGNHHNIALLKLSLPLFSNSQVGYAHLPKRNESIKEGKPVRTFKFGRPINTSLSVRQVNLNIVNRKHCREKYRSINITISKDQVCARNESIRIGCVGSMGFPLVDKKNRIIGLVTFPVKCLQMIGSDFPTIYTRVSSYIEWIYSKL